MKKILTILLLTIISTSSFAGPREDAERVAALSFYGIECGKLTSDGTYMLGTQQGSMEVWIKVYIEQLKETCLI